MALGVGADRRVRTADAADADEADDSDDILALDSD